jgi:CheY-like chemotaxis protein
VHLAYDGREGLEAALQLQPDVAIIDIGLPTLNGYEIARQLRKSYGQNSIHLIALTGWGQEDDRRRARAGPRFAVGAGVRVSFDIRIFPKPTYRAVP